jgi:hypothetical protein
LFLSLPDIVEETQHVVAIVVIISSRHSIGASEMQKEPPSSSLLSLAIRPWLSKARSSCFSRVLSRGGAAPRCGSWRGGGIGQSARQSHHSARAFDFWDVCGTTLVLVVLGSLGSLASIDPPIAAAVSSTGLLFLLGRQQHLLNATFHSIHGKCPAWSQAYTILVFIRAGEGEPETETDRLLPCIPIGTYRIVHGNLLLLFSHDEFLFIGSSFLA